MANNNIACDTEETGRVKQRYLPVYIKGFRTTDNWITNHVTLS